MTENNREYSVPLPLIQCRKQKRKKRSINLIIIDKRKAYCNDEDDCDEFDGQEDTLLF